MAEFCATHPDASSTGSCAVCSRPFCPACVVEEVASERSFCSATCAQSGIASPVPESRLNRELIDDLRKPIRSGWQLWGRQWVAITTRVALPVGVLLGLVRIATQHLSAGDEARAGMEALASLLLCGALAVPAVAVILSHAHTGSPEVNPWPTVARRFVPWVIAWFLVIAAASLGSLLFLIPGLIIGVRFFWADEFALIHGHGPLSALRESLTLTRGLTGRVFGFQVVLGFAEYLVFIPLMAGFVAVGAVEASIPASSFSTFVASVLVSFLITHAYASAHAAEVVYFYGLRALRAELPAEEIRGDWVSRGLRESLGH